jgi:glucosamine-6-phosphate deaminase
VADAVQNPRSIDNPASALQACRGARFYLTRGAAHHLAERNLADLARRKEIPESELFLRVMDLSLSKGKRLEDLTEADMRSDRFCSLLLDRSSRKAPEIAAAAASALVGGIRKSRQKVVNTRYLHTGPHHDDIMLGYLGYLNHLLREPTNSHKFLVMTSGFTSVTNRYVLSLLEDLEQHLAAPELQQLIKKGYFETSDTKDVETALYLEGHADRNDFVRSKAQSRRLLRILLRVLEENDVKNLMNRMTELKNYFRTQYPGKKDIQLVQKIKGSIREWEEDLIWGYFGFKSEDVIHGRLGFYTGDIFTKEPDITVDVLPVLKAIRKTNPDVVTVALDPEGSGPDTHYKVMQAVAEALRLWEKESGRSDIRVLGYRNVWYTFHPAEANIIMPVSLRTMTIQNDSFLNCYPSQKAASFPSHVYQGPFSELAQKIQFDQYTKLRTLLGPDFFLTSEDMLIRASKGFMFIRELTLPEFYSLSAELKRSVENL